MAAEEVRLANVPTTCYLLQALACQQWLARARTGSRQGSTRPRAVLAVASLLPAALLTHPPPVALSYRPHPFVCAQVEWAALRHISNHNPSTT